MPQAPIFEDIFGIPWSQLPAVMQKHYAVRVDSKDRVSISGTMNIKCGMLIRLMAPLLVWFGALVPYGAENIPVTVVFYSGLGSNKFHFDRKFYFPGRPVFTFHSVLEPFSGGEVIEFMRSGLGWRSIYRINGKHVNLIHRSYVWRIAKWLIPLPLEWTLGKGAAAEEALSDDAFRMWMTITHPVFGEIYRYEGSFKIDEVVYG